MTEVYRGKVMTPRETAIANARAAKKKREARIRLIRILSLCILFAALLTRLMVSAAAYSNIRSKAIGERSQEVTLTNRIGSVQFEIEREIRPENLTYKAATTLGMVEPGSDATVEVEVARAN